MLLTWTSLIRRSLARRRRRSRPRNLHFHEPAYVQMETLEERMLLTVFTSNDAYTTYKDTFNSANEGAASVLANDFDADGQTLTASLVSGPTHGSVVMHADVSFVYVPNANYYGADSFVYLAADSVASANGTATLTVTPAFSAQTNAPDQPFTGIMVVAGLPTEPLSTSQLTGEAQTA